MCRTPNAAADGSNPAFRKEHMEPREELGTTVISLTKLSSLRMLCEKEAIDIKPFPVPGEEEKPNRKLDA